ncbi:MAG TPA: EamA family transporter [Puia sp.]|nr:EamA family transporter [Puia sp.]
MSAGPAGGSVGITERQAPVMLVVIAFATVYLVWGSTYFFIALSVAHIPPMLVGVFRYLSAGLAMLCYCLVRREKLFSWAVIRPAAVSGFLLLCCGNGCLIWAEQYIPSGLAAILLASGPVWFVVLDRRKWDENFRSVSTIVGLIVGFGGVLLLFAEQLHGGVYAGWHTAALAVLVCGSVSWAAGSLFSKYRSAPVSNAVNAGWQMLSAGLVFIPASLLSGEWGHFSMAAVPFSSWAGIIYLVTMGSLVGYSAFVWLLQVRPATQVSTHAYVNPVVAVLLGVLFGGERLSALQLVGLVVILSSVLLINLAKYRRGG